MQKKVLIVEDSKNISFMIEMCLKTNGYQVFKASDGVEAMVKIFDIIPDLILLDILIPKLNGYSVCEAVKSNEKISRIPIIAMSAKTQDEDIQKAFELGVSDYLAKPFSPAELLSAVRKYLNH
jgi:DNA-binding response OmpR family regulator